MIHEPKLTVYTIRIKPGNLSVENSNMDLFKYKIGQPNEKKLDPKFIFAEIARLFISALDTPEMFSDPATNKCMTANQPNVGDENVNTNIFLHLDKCIIEGKVEGGTYGRKRNKTSILDKSNKTGVSQKDAITDDFYFHWYAPLESNKMILMIQSYSDDSIDSVMKRFWTNFLSHGNEYYKPEIKRYVPKVIIDNFKKNATVSSLTFSTEIPGETLINQVTTFVQKNYQVTVQIKPIRQDLTIQEFEETLAPIQNNLFSKISLWEFLRKKGELRDTQTNKTTPFELGSSFKIKPSIMLSKFIEIKNDETDFERIKKYCFDLLDSIKEEIYIHYGIQEG